MCTGSVHRRFPSRVAKRRDEHRAAVGEARDFDSADAVRDELIDMGVTVLDNDMVWYVGDRPKGFREQCTYTRQAGNEVVEVDVEKVEELIMERAFLRRNRDFVGADEVRDALTEIGVRVLDLDSLQPGTTHQPLPPARRCSSPPPPPRARRESRCRRRRTGSASSRTRR